MSIVQGTGNNEPAVVGEGRQPTEVRLPSFPDTITHRCIWCRTKTYTSDIACKRHISKEHAFLHSEIPDCSEANFVQTALDRCRVPATIPENNISLPAMHPFRGRPADAQNIHGLRPAQNESRNTMQSVNSGRKAGGLAQKDQTSGQSSSQQVHDSKRWKSGSRDKQPAFMVDAEFQHPLSYGMTLGGAQTWQQPDAMASGFPPNHIHSLNDDSMDYDIHDNSVNYDALHDQFEEIFRSSHQYS